MKYPFQVGEPVHEKLFYDRKEIVEELINSFGYLSSVRQDFALIGPRRIGKTSILLVLKERLERKGIVTVYIDCTRIVPETLENFLKIYLERTTERYSKVTGDTALLDHVKSAISGTLSGILSLVKEIGGKIAETFEIWIKFDKREASKQELLEKVLNYPKELQKRNSVPFVIMLDEFPNTPEFETFSRFLRAVMQTQKNVAYIISGSSVGMMERILFSRKSPLFNLFLIKRVGPIDEKSARKLLRDNFRKAKVKFSADAINKILDITGSHPYYLQWLGRSCLNLSMMSKRIIEPPLVEEALKMSLSENSGHFLELFSKLKGKSVDILASMALFDLERPIDISKKINLGVDKVVNYLGRLQENDYIEKPERGKYIFSDKMFKLWLKDRFEDQE